jgi:uncharacterized protein
MELTLLKKESYSAIKTYFRQAAIGFISLFACLSASAWDKDSLAQLQPLAEKGNAEAQYFVGMLYQLGIGGATRDLKQAFTWFEKADNANDPLGAYKVGCFYGGQFPDIVAVDLDKALTHKLIAAQAGYSLAQSDVGTLYFQRADFINAEKWWLLSAAQANATAANNLSVLYQQGKARPADLISAYAWFNIAYIASRRKMDDKAEAHLDAMAATMSRADIRAAKKLAREWRGSPSALTVAALNPKPNVEALLKLRLDTPN